MTDAWVGLSALQHGLINHTGITGAGGGGGPFFIVASVNTPSERQAMAQWVCDGMADEVEINAACAAANAGQSGGMVLLLEGDYYLADNIITGWTHHFMGCGYESTYLYFDQNNDPEGHAGPMVNVEWGPYNDEYGIVYRGTGVCSDFSLSMGNYSGNGFRGGVSLRNQHAILERVHLEVEYNAATQPRQNAAVRMEGEYCTVRDCRIESAPVAFDLSADQDGQRMIANRVESATVGVWMNGTAEDVSVIGNFFHGAGVLGPTPYLGFQDSEDYEYANNVGVAVFAGVSRDPVIVLGNRISDFKTGVVLEGCEEVHVVGNTIYSGAFNNGVPVSAGILLMDGAWYNYVHGNMVRRGTSSDQFLYGIEVQAGAGENQVGPNDLHMSGATGPFIDNGSNTRQGMILYSPNGTGFNIRVANDGTVGASEVVTT